MKGSKGGELTSVWGAKESSHLAFSAASRRRWITSLRTGRSGRREPENSAEREIERERERERENERERRMMHEIEWQTQEGEGAVTRCERKCSDIMSKHASEMVSQACERHRDNVDSDSLEASKRRWRKRVRESEIEQQEAMGGTRTSKRRAVTVSRKTFLAGQK
eukprot:677643-Rhodomonas_salina.6